MIRQLLFPIEGFSPIQLLLDPLSLFFVSVILLISIPSAIFSLGYFKEEYSINKIYYAWVMLAGFIASMLLVVTASNLIVFLIAWEIMSLVSFFLVIFDFEQWKSVKAGIIYIIMTHIGTAFITAAFILMYKHAHSFDFVALKTACQSMPPATKNIVFLFLLVGFGTKAGIVPLHIWLPYAHPQAPSPVSSIMSGVMIKTAIYGMIRFIIFTLGVNNFWWGNLVLILASVSCLVGIMYALMEQDIKKLLAYSSVENIGIILIGIGASMVFLNLNMPFLSVLAMTAGLYHLINHAIFKSLLFLCAGSVYKSTGLRDMEKLGGLIKKMPWTALSFLAGSMAISALPPFNGFISEWLTLQVLFSGVLHGTTGNMKLLMSLYAAVLALTGGFAAACFVKAFGIIFLGLPRSEQAKEAKEVSSSMIYVTVSLSALALVFGLFAVPVTKVLVLVSEQALGLDLGGFNFTANNFFLLPQHGKSISLASPLIAFLLVFIAGIAFVFIRFYLPFRKTSIAPTWACGYYNLDATSEYTATGFSKPFRVALSFFYRPRRKTEEIKESMYHIKSRKYETSITPVFKQYIYKTIINRAFGTANVLSKLQSGSIHFYLAYIFIVLVLLLIFRNSI